MSGRGSRGRGRGSSRGRGGSGRRGGRGRSGGRGGRGRGGGYSRGRGGRSYVSSPEPSQPKETDQEETLSVQNDLKKYFVGTASFDQHYDAQEENKVRYVAGMTVLDNNGVEISQNARVRALAAAWSRKDHDMANSFLMDKNKFGLVEVLKALTLLDSSRCIRVEEKKLKRLQMQKKVKSKVMGKFKSKIDNLTALKPKCGSASGAICKHIRRWVKTFSAEELEFYALHYPSDPWKKLSDICHFNPKKDFNLNWFLPYCFGEAAPEGTLVQRCKNVTAENVNSLLVEFDIPYTHVKQFLTNLVDDSKAKIAATDKINQVIWWYEDLQCDKVDEVLNYRFNDQGGLKELDLPYGKLMERLLTIKMLREGISESKRSIWGKQPERIENPTKAPFFPLLIPIAQERLLKINLNLESPIVVIGDMSSSMNVAIRTSTIISSLLTAITSAKLVFFNDKNHTAQFIPTNIEEVLEMAVTIQANGSTAPAASLYPFYQKKEIVKTFIIVTDEEENTPYKGYKFLELYKKYREEVYPSRLVFVSFLHSQHAIGQMVSQLERSDVPVMQFKLDQLRPDLTKLDTLFGLLSSDTGNFEEQVTAMETDLKSKGLQKVFQDLTMKEEEKKDDSKVTPSNTNTDVNSSNDSGSGDVTDVAAENQVMQQSNTNTEAESSTVAEKIDSTNSK